MYIIQIQHAQRLFSLYLIKFQNTLRLLSFLNRAHVWVFLISVSTAWLWIHLWGVGSYVYVLNLKFLSISVSRCFYKIFRIMVRQMAFVISYRSNTALSMNDKVRSSKLLSWVLFWPGRPV